MISVCVPVYNGEKYLERCLDSILGQTYSNFEVVICYDPSTDKTFEIIQNYRFKDPRIRLIQHTEKPGLVENWNRCILHSHGEWIKFLFQDDVMKPNCLEAFIKASATGKSFYLCEREFIIDQNASEELRDFYQNKIIRLEKCIPNQNYLSTEQINYLAIQLGGKNFLGEPTSFFFKKTLIPKLGFFNHHLIQICDYEMALRLAQNDGLGYIPERLIQFTIHGNNTSQQNHNQNEFRLSKIDPLILYYLWNYSPEYSQMRLFAQSNNIYLTPILTNHILIIQQIIQQNQVSSDIFHSVFTILSQKFPHLFAMLRRV